MAKMKSRAQDYADKRETIHMCLGCNKEVTGDDEGDSQLRIARHISDSSANEAINHQDEPSKQHHVSARCWRQIMATYKLGVYHRKRREGHVDEEEMASGSGSRAVYRGGMKRSRGQGR